MHQCGTWHGSVCGAVACGTVERGDNDPDPAEPAEVLPARAVGVPGAGAVVGVGSSVVQ
jgi:hypothetical protein